MKDLDFDELDRAVNSILSDNEKVPTASPEIPQILPRAPLPIVTTESQDEPVIRIENDLTSSVVQSPLVKPVLPATRRTGRFMDVVHRSSDMRKANTIAAPSRIATASSFATVENTRRNALQTPASDNTVVSVEQSTTATPYAAPLVSEWPDPVDIPASLTSPFLPDAKVEKRPLGGHQTEASMPAELVMGALEPTAAHLDLQNTLEHDGALLSSETEGKADDRQLPPEVENAAPILPVELSSDLVTIESEDAAKSSESEPSTVDITPLEMIHGHMGVPDATSDIETNKEVSFLGAGSIPQQYTAQLSTSDTSHAPMYDTDEVNPVLVHPAKKKSGWLWVVWIMLILALGAGMGAAAFYIGLF